MTREEHTEVKHAAIAHHNLTQPPANPPPPQLCCRAPQHMAWDVPWAAVALLPWFCPHSSLDPQPHAGRATQGAEMALAL